MTNTNVEMELSKLRTAADTGYRLANANYLKIERSLRKAEHHIEIANEEQKNLQQIQTAALISKQNEELKQLRQTIGFIKENIDALRERSKDFSIVVFGRAMSGKSTLMEILTQGDGSSIGKGAEKTTRSIRTYYWNGLKITDVPDFDFFKDAQNDKLGMEAALTADLILFLLTDDAPQPEEAQCLAQLKSLGKSILGVLNLKQDINLKRRDYTLKGLQKIFADDEKINAVIAQFRNLAKDYHQNWNDIKFVPTHLAAAYNAITKKKFDNEIYTASHFVEVENAIIEKVRTDGKFLRIKNFVDTVAVPMDNILLKLFEHSAISLKESKLWLKKSKEIKAWRQQFWDRSQSKLYRLFSEISAELTAEIETFTEENYDNEKINEKWQDSLHHFLHVERYQNLLREISDECSAELRNFGDELTQELKYSFDGKTQTDIKLEDEESPLWAKFTTFAIPSLLMLVPGLGWTARIAVGVGASFFQTLFERKKNKIREAKERIGGQLKESGFKALNRINDQARDVLNRQILANVNAFIDLLISYAHMLARLGKSQSEIAETLINDYEDLNAVLFVEAVEYKGAGRIDDVKVTLRVPGTISVVIAEDSNVNTRAISELLGERFFVMKPLDNWDSTMKKMLGCEFELETYPLEVETDHKTYSVTPKGKVSNKRLKLTQQISPYPIMTA